ncbi:hypothetical protein H3301_gp006 [IAS virus]|nr:hypothetical protein H3301_gp006 [IAS virus]
MGGFELVVAVLFKFILCLIGLPGILAILFYGTAKLIEFFKEN